MIMNKDKIDLKSLSVQDLKQREDELRREFFRVRLQRATQPIKDYKQFKKLRHEIARCLTFLRQKSVETKG